VKTLLAWAAGALLTALAAAFAWLDDVSREEDWQGITDD